MKPAEGNGHGRGLGGLLAAALLAALALVLLTSPGKAEASCIYNVGSTEPGSNAIAFNFSSNASGIDAYSSSALAPGSSQCWYGVGWSGGRIGITGSPNDLVLQNYVAGIEVEPHGWVEAIVENMPEEARNEACQYYVPEGMANLSVLDEAGDETLSVSNQLPVGTDCFGLNLDAERPALGSKAEGELSQFVLAADPQRGSKTKSVTIHVYGARGRKPLGSVCLGGDEQSALALRAARHGAITFGASENRQGCKDPRVAEPERRGTPRPDRSYSPGCFGRRPGNLRLVRYPEDFGATKRASCAPRR